MKIILTYLLIIISLALFGQTRFVCCGIQQNDSIDSFTQFKNLFNTKNEINTTTFRIIKNKKPIFIYGDRPFDDSIRIIKNSNNNFTIYENLSCGIPCKNGELFKFDLSVNDTLVTIGFDSNFYKTNVICKLDSGIVLSRYRQYCNDTNYTRIAQTLDKEEYIKNALSLAHDLTILALTGNKSCIDILKSYEKTIRVIAYAGWNTEIFLFCYIRIIDTIIDFKKEISIFH
jgi:hypothetical protein